nr:AAC3-I [uncultured bacterium]
MLIYRRLTEADAEAMRQMNQMFGAAFKDTKTYRYDQGDDAYFQRILGKDHVIVLACFHAGQVVGGLVAYVLDKLEMARSEIYIYDLAVDESHRRQGIATELINELKAIAAKTGAWVIFVQADREDEPAIQLYEKLGVREEPLHFDINLEEGNG